MNKRIASVVLVSAMGVGAVSISALAPAFAETTVTVASSRLTEIKTALKGLVTDGTLTQTQADKVASTLDAALPKGGHGGMRGGRGLTEAATVLGMTEADLRTALEGGKSLAQVAATKNLSKATLISKLVAAAETRLAAEVKAGTLTQAQADARKADLTERITEMVDRVGLPAHRGHGAPPVGAGPSA